MCAVSTVNQSVPIACRDVCLNTLPHWPLYHMPQSLFMMKWKQRISGQNDNYNNTINIFTRHNPKELFLHYLTKRGQHREHRVAQLEVTGQHWQQYGVDSCLSPTIMKKTTHLLYIDGFY